jgi:hypothetical protein
MKAIDILSFLSTVFRKFYLVQIDITSLYFKPQSFLRSLRGTVQYNRACMASPCVSTLRIKAKILRVSCLGFYNIANILSEYVCSTNQTNVIIRIEWPPNSMKAQEKAEMTLPAENCSPNN